jgi:transposase
MTAKRIHQDLISEHDFREKYHSVRRYVRSLISAPDPPVRRMEVAPGQEIQVDYGMGARCTDHTGKLRKTYLFRLVLSHSRKGYTEAVTRLTTESFIRSLENAFRILGGVPKIVVFDNAKSVVKQADWYDAELNPKINAFCKHYGITIVPTRPRTPEHKGKVERGVDYAQENAIKGMTFESVALQNQHLLQWEKTVADTRIHGTTKKHVGKQFIEVEKPALGPLKAARVFISRRVIVPPHPSTVNVIRGNCGSTWLGGWKCRMDQDFERNDLFRNSARNGFVQSGRLPRIKIRGKIGLN